MQMHGNPIDCTSLHPFPPFFSSRLRLLVALNRASQPVSHQAAPDVPKAIGGVLSALGHGPLFSSQQVCPSPDLDLHNTNFPKLICLASAHSASYLPGLRGTIAERCREDHTPKPKAPKAPKTHGVDYNVFRQISLGNAHGRASGSSF